MNGSLNRIELEPAYVLHSRAYRETSQILELFTAHHGRIGVIARGARRPKSAFRGLLNPFQPLRLSWSGRGELGTLTQAEFSGPSAPLQGEAVMAGFYVNELLLKLMERADPHPDLFLHYASLVGNLADGQALEPTLRLFEMLLLREIGYAPDFTQDSSQGQSIAPDEVYEFNPESGAAQTGSGDVQGNVYRGSTLLEIGELQFESEETLRSAKRLLRDILNYHLGDRQLQTRRVASAMKR